MNNITVKTDRQLHNIYENRLIACVDRYITENNLSVSIFDVNYKHDLDVASILTEWSRETQS